MKFEKLSILNQPNNAQGTRKLEIRTSSVELEGALELDDRGCIAFGHGKLELLQGLVVVGDVALMVLLVVELHNLAAYRRLQGPVVIGQIGQREGHQAA